MPERPLAPALRPFDAVGGWTIAVVDSLGRFGAFFAEALAVLVTPPFKFRAFVDRIHFIGYNSLLIIFLTGAFTGMVLGLQIYLTLVRFGSEAFLGPAVALSLIRELGPVLAALMVTGRAGSALTAELGIMRITEQIDALTVMALNPMRYLVAPSILAGLVTFPLMTAIFDVVGITKSFGRQKVLRELSLEVPTGSITVIIGRSGGGKSVFLKHLIGLLRPDGGRILVGGVEITGLRGRRWVSRGWAPSFRPRSPAACASAWPSRGPS